MKKVTQQRPPMPKWNESAVIWSEDLKFHNKLTTIDAKSFQAWVYDVLPQVKGMKRTALRGDPEKSGLRLGEFWLILRNMPLFLYEKEFFFGFPLGAPRWRKTKLPVDRRGRDITWNAPVNIPVLLTGNGHDDTGVWMSLSPSEVVTQRAGVKRARGRVLMGGLGMGWLARRVLEREQVNHVTIYDTNEDVLDFFGKPLKEEFNGKVTLKLGDVYDATPKKYDRILLDIWKGYGDAEFDQRLRELRTKVPSKALWMWGYTPRDY